MKKFLALSLVLALAPFWIPVLAALAFFGALFFVFLVLIAAALE
jgi:hypothetical protein